MPRYRWDQLLVLAWRTYLPLVLAGVFFVSIIFVSTFNLHDLSNEQMLLVGILVITRKSNKDKKIYNIIIKRTVLTSGTILTPIQVENYRKITYLFTKYAKMNDQTPNSFFKFLEKALSIDVKCTQHFINATYPTKKYSLSDLQECYPDFTYEIPHQKINTLDYKFSVSAIAAYLLKKKAFPETLRNIKISLLEPENSYIKDAVAIKQTGQTAPDYKLKISEDLTKYYDLKATLHAINKGHLILIGDFKIYEELVEKLLNEQRIFYGLRYPKLSALIGNLITEDQLSWHDRNKITQEFIMNDMELLKIINPTMIFTTDLLEHHNTKINKNFDKYINTRSFLDKEATENTIASWMKEDDSIIEFYSRQQGHNKNILTKIIEISTQTLDILKKTC